MKDSTLGNKEKQSCLNEARWPYLKELQLKNLFETHLEVDLTTCSGSDSDSEHCSSSRRVKFRSQPCFNKPQIALPPDGAIKTPRLNKSLETWRVCWMTMFQASWTWRRCSWGGTPPSSTPPTRSTDAGGEANGCRRFPGPDGWENKARSVFEFIHLRMTGKDWLTLTA